MLIALPSALTNSVVSPENAQLLAIFSLTLLCIFTTVCGGVQATITFHQTFILGSKTIMILIKISFHYSIPTMHAMHHVNKLQNL